METRTIAAIGTACWLAAAAPLALAATQPAKDEAKPAPAADAAKAESAADAKAVKAAGPRLQMREHPGRNPGKDRDLRHCLDLPTPKEVIRCSEQK